MSQNSELSMSRIDARTPLTVRDTSDRAAALQGWTRTDFLIEAALEKAERGIAEQTLTRLTLRDQELLAKALTEESVSESNRFLKSLTSDADVSENWARLFDYVRFAKPVDVAKKSANRARNRLTKYANGIKLELYDRYHS